MLYKFADDQGNYLAALLAYYGFLSLFPLLLLAVTVLGFALHGDPHLQHQLLNSALKDFPIVGKQIQTNVHGYSGSAAALAIGVLGSVYGALGVAQAGQNAMNVVWGVPRNARPSPIKARVRSLGILMFLGVGVLATTGLSGVATGAHSFAHTLHFGAGGPWLATILSVALNVVLFVIAFRVLTVASVTTRDVIGGAVVAALAWQVLQALGTYYVAHKLKGSSEVYGVFAVVLGLVAWLYLGSIIVVLCAEFNVVLRRRLWPRSLLTPFTDNVTLTTADMQAYRSYARSQRFKGFETIDVDFAEPSTAPLHPPESPPGSRETDDGLLGYEVPSQHDRSLPPSHLPRRGPKNQRRSPRKVLNGCREESRRAMDIVVRGWKGAGRHSGRPLSNLVAGLRRRRYHRDRAGHGDDHP